MSIVISHRLMRVFLAFRGARERALADEHQQGNTDYADFADFADRSGRRPVLRAAARDGIREIRVIREIAVQLLGLVGRAHSKGSGFLKTRCEER